MLRSSSAADRALRPARSADGAGVLRAFAGRLDAAGANRTQEVSVKGAAKCVTAAQPIVLAREVLFPGRCQAAA